MGGLPGRLLLFVGREAQSALPREGVDAHTDALGGNRIASSLIYVHINRLE
jgi:hypothetical protein